MEEFAANGQILAALEKNISTRPCMDFSTMKNPEVNIETKEFVINNKIAGTNGTHLNVNFLNCIEDKDSSCSKFLEKQWTFYVNAIFLETFINVADYSDPVINKFEIKNTAVGSNFYIRQYFTLQLSQLVTDEAWIINEANTINYIQPFE